jgi:carbon-monoxide dehydrogenase large subunit
VNPQRRYVGTSVLRTEDPRFLAGRARYTDDVSLPRMLHAAVVRSPHPHADVVKIDAEAARQIPGVAAILFQEDFEGRIAPFETTIDRPDVKTFTRPALDSQRAYFVGQPIGLVLASSRYVAEDAIDAIDIEWEILDPVLGPEEALAPGAPVLRPELGDNRYAHIEFEEGDVEQAFADADRVFSKRFHHGRCSAAPLETRALIADYNITTGDMTVWASSQFPHFLRTCISGALDVSESQIRVISDAVGGGFGQKAEIYEEDYLIPAASMITGRPVKWIEDRYENLAASSQAKEVICDIEIAVDDDGTFRAFRGHYINVSGAWPMHPTTSLLDGLAAASLLPSIYKVQAVSYVVDDVITNRCTLGPYRGVGWTPGHSARETLIDEIARELDIDPAELRLQNAIPDAPYTSATGMNYDGGSYSASTRKAMEMMDYDGVRERQRELRKEGRYIGIGLSPWVEPTAWGSEMAARNGMNFQYYDSAKVTIEPDGSVTVTNGCHNHGQAHETTFAQVAADALGVSLESVRVVMNDTAKAAYGAGTGASRSAVVAGGAIMRAGREVREHVLSLAGDAIEVSPDDLDIMDGVIQVKGSPGKSMTIKEVAGYAYFGGRSRPDHVAEGLSSTRAYDPPETYSNGCVAAVVEIDPETGEIRIEKLYVCEDCGTILNPMVVDGQLHGGVAQGVGLAVLEDIVYDESGQLLTGTLMDYLYPTTMDIPGMEISHIETPATGTEGGIKGMGESGTIAGEAVVLSAISDALAPFGNIVIPKSPIGPSEVRDLIRGAQADSGTPSAAAAA